VRLQWGTAFDKNADQGSGVMTKLNIIRPASVAGVKRSEAVPVGDAASRDARTACALDQPLGPPVQGCTTSTRVVPRRRGAGDPTAAGNGIAACRPIRRADHPRAAGVRRNGSRDYVRSCGCCRADRERVSPRAA
jgi:hypothetical protein